MIKHFLLHVGLASCECRLLSYYDAVFEDVDFLV